MQGDSYQDSISGRLGPGCYQDPIKKGLIQGVDIRALSQGCWNYRAADQGIGHKGVAQGAGKMTVQRDRALLLGNFLEKY